MRPINACAVALAASALLSGCDVPGTQPVPASPDLSHGPSVTVPGIISGRDVGDARRVATVEQTARVDLRCADVHTVADFGIDHFQAAVLRFVVEGCGTRALYLEGCQHSVCQYLLVSKLSLATETGPGPATSSTTPHLENRPIPP